MILALRDIHLPDPIPFIWWPLAPGIWCLVFLLLFSIVIVFAWIRYRRYMAPLYHAQKEWHHLQETPQLNEVEKLQRLSILLRRTALTLYPRDEVAGLYGEKWLQFLEKPMKNHSFTQGPGRILAEGPYCNTATPHLNVVFQICWDWLRAIRMEKIRSIIKYP